MKTTLPLGFVAVLIMVTLALGALVFVPKKSSVSPDTAALATAYVVSMRDIVAEYRASPTQLAARKAESRMLNLTVPVEHRDIHLDLVLALHRYGSISATNPKTLAAAKEKVNTTIDSATWLQ